MAGTSHVIDRRRALQIVVAAVCCGGASQAQGSESPIQSIDQITDVSATAATDMFRFAPDLVLADPGAEIAFLNSRGEHTVHSIPQFWPEGVPEVGISNQKEALVSLPTAGLYGFRCKRHGQYGMVMLVVAGDGGDLSGVQDKIEQMRASAREKQAFADLITRYETTKPS
ncbi:plastocyanin/azurin family copper-binding protein [Algihabitans albus]|uniref:plastocyanin/azurin family copper-binding protein n=1 Tax=Algihabitans albus TaxID=2164067 RepID=UPI000E5D95E8|nr:plastocyanin/azurin family copper-binding protein [Algihabitans albus]